jgi:beta-phosphoglucomutase-like phosphatase (HAD superfamily)
VIAGIDVGRIETVLFDVDGTLIDSNAAHTRAWAQALHEHGVAIREEEVRRLIGMGGDKLLPAAAKVEEESDRVHPPPGHRHCGRDVGRRPGVECLAETRRR